MQLGPLRETHQTFFFAVPPAENHGSLWLPTRLQQFAYSMDTFEHCGGAAVGVDCAIHPGIAMVARDHPLIGQVGAAHATDHIPKRAELVILLEMHFHSHRTGTY